MAADLVRLVDTATHAVLQVVPLAPVGGSGPDPSAFVFSPDGDRLYVLENLGRRVDVLR